MVPLVLLECGRFPNAFESRRDPEEWAHRHSEKRALFARFEDLLNQSGFANLSWPGHHLKKSSWFGKPLGEGRGLGSFVGVHDFTQCVELIYSMY